MTQTPPTQTDLIEALNAAFKRRSDALRHQTTVDGVTAFHAVNIAAANAEFEAALAALAKFERSKANQLPTIF